MLQYRQSAFPTERQFYEREAPSVLPFIQTAGGPPRSLGHHGTQLCSTDPILHSFLWGASCCSYPLCCGVSERNVRPLPGRVCPYPTSQTSRRVALAGVSSP